MVIIDIAINTLFGGLTLDPAGMHCPSWNDAFVSSLHYISAFLLTVLILSLSRVSMLIHARSMLMHAQRDIVS